MTKTGCIYCMYEELDEYEEPCRYCEDASEFRDKAGWIPCSERYPDEPDEKFIVSVVVENEKFVDLATYDGYKYWDEYKTYEVIAWMPLPEAYKGETE